MSEKSHTAKVQFTGYIDVNPSKWEGVTKYNVKNAIDSMDEKELRDFLKMNYDTCLTYFEK